MSTKPLCLLPLLLLAACNPQQEAKAPAHATAADWPASLPVTETGFAAPSSPCRVVGESGATSNYLDDSATLVGCRNAADVEPLGGKIVATVDGVTLVSVPRIHADASDAKDPVTGFHATTEIACSGYLKFPAGNCPAGVIRSNRQGVTVVTINWPEGMERNLYFNAEGKVSGADTSQADGSASHNVIGKRQEDNTIVSIGPERYEIPDVLVQGD